MMWEKLQNWIDVIDDIIYNYNHSKNRGIGIEPYRVNNAIETIIINSKRNQTEKLKEKIPDEFKVGDSVRVLRKKKTYEDKLMNKYHDIIFKVVKVKNNSLVIEDDEGNEYTTKKKYCFVVNPDPVEYPKVDSAIIQTTKDMRINKELRKLK